MYDLYAAGFFDGEGYVGVSYQEVWDACMLRVAVANNHKNVLDFFVEEYRGRVIPPSKQGPKNGKTCWVWTANGPDALAFLSRIQPYVIVKKPQVELALTFPIGATGVRVPDEVKAVRRAIMAELKDMKQAYNTPSKPTDKLRKDLEERSDVREAIRVYGEGKSCREVGVEIRQNASTISYWLRQLGVTRSIGEALTAHDRKDGVGNTKKSIRAAELYDEGKSAAEVAKELHEKPATVNYWLRKMGKTRSLKDAQKLRREREAA